MTDDKVSMRDLYDAISRLEEKMDDKWEKLDGRVNALESVRDRLWGIVGLIGLFSGSIANFIWEKIRGS